jgi:hypothetical protein
MGHERSLPGRQILPRCHLLDYTIQSPELRSVEFTAAAKENSNLLEVDATAASFIAGELTAVGTPNRLRHEFPSRKQTCTENSPQFFTLRGPLHSKPGIRVPW